MNTKRNGRKAMKAKHTPGPWHVTLDPETDQPVECGYGMFEVHHDSVAICDGASLANARLIAAAPELLEAAVEAANQLYAARIAPIRPNTHGWHSCNDAEVKLRAAITKAEEEQG